MLQLRDYQQQAVKSVLVHFRQKPDAAVLVLPTGAGKSLVIAELARLARGRVLVLAHVKELVEQNHAKYQSYGLEAAIFSASLGRKETAAKVVFALSRPASVTPELLAAIKAYRTKGFKYLLDDACTDNDSEQLIALADIIRIDMARTNLADIERHKALYSRAGLQWLAAHVETDANFSSYKALGCDLFQGYFLPDKLIVAGKKIEPAAVKLSQIIACLFAEQPDINQLSELLHHEPAIVMAMLKIANSPLYRKARAVGSVKEMVTRLGLALVRKWVMTYTVLGAVPSDAVTIVLTRADCMQRIAQQWQLDSEQCQQFFLAGLLSGTDRLFGIESSVFLSQLNLTASIKQAIKQSSGIMAQALALVLSIEKGYALGLPANEAELAYQSCYHLALADILQHLAGVGH